MSDITPAAAPLINVMRPPSIGSIPSDVPPGLRSVLSSLKEAVEVRNGQRGDPLEQSVTLRMLAGIDGINVNLGGRVGVPPSIGWSSPDMDLSEPPALINLAAAGALAAILLTWGVPSYRNHSYAEIWRSDVNDLGTATMVGMTPGAAYSDAVGGDRTCYYWVRAVSTANVKGPYNAVSGVKGQTAKDPGYLLDVLTGQIKESQLYSSLNSRINLIDGPDTLPGSVAAQIKSEATTRTAADSAIGTRIDSLAVTVNGNTAAISAESTARANADGTLFAQYTVKVDLNGRVAGFGLASTANNGIPTSEFAVVADRFYIAPPGQAGKGNMPFVVQASDTIINGILVPAGVYIDAAYIKVGTISKAMIGLAAIDDARISDLSAAKITAGIIAADRLDANIITSKGLTVDAAKITTGFIDVARIGDATIGGAKIVNASIGTAQIADGSITTAKIGYAAIGTAQIGDGTITNAKIGYLAVDTAKIQDGAITNAKISYASIDSAKIQDAAITTAKIGTAQVDTLRIAGEAVTVPRAATSPSGVAPSDRAVVACSVYMPPGITAIIANAAGIFTSAYMTAGQVFIRKNGNIVSRFDWDSSFDGAIPLSFLDTAQDGGTFDVLVSASTTWRNVSLVCLGVKR